MARIMVIINDSIVVTELVVLMFMVQIQLAELVMTATLVVSMINGKRRWW